MIQSRNLLCCGDIFVVLQLLSKPTALILAHSVKFFPCVARDLRKMAKDRSTRKDTSLL